MRRLASALALALLLLPGVASAATGSYVEAARPWIGILIGQGAKGVLVKEVLPKTPAERSGLKAGDQVLAIDGVAVRTEGELIGKVQEKGVGQRVSLRLQRGPKEVAIQLALEAKPDELKMLQDRLLGRPAPLFAVKGLTPASLKGQVLVVEFWATWCGPCRSALPRLGEWQKRYGQRGLKIVGISDEAAPLVAKFASDKKLQHLVGSDPSAKDGYGVPAIPMFVVVDRAGIVRYVDLGAGSKLDGVEQAFVPLLGAK